MADDNIGLRRLVARLAQETPSDIDAVLEALSAPERRLVSELLAAHQGEEIAPVAQRAAATDHAPAVTHIRGLSPWFASRLERSAGREHRKPPSWFAKARGSVQFDNDGGFEMTPHAQRALQDAALALSGTGGARKPGFASPPETVWARARGAIEGLWR